MLRQHRRVRLARTTWPEQLLRGSSRHPAHRPYGVRPHDRRFVGRQVDQQRQQGGIPGIAGDHARIAQQAGQFQPFDRRAAEDLGKTRRGERENLPEAQRRDVAADGQQLLPARAREPVPRTSQP